MGTIVRVRKASRRAWSYACSRFGIASHTQAVKSPLQVAIQLQTRNGVPLVYRPRVHLRSTAAHGVCIHSS